MARGIIVVDVPVKCEHCKLAKYVTCNDRFCMPMRKYVYIEQMYRKPDWCPIRPIPERVDEHDTHYDSDYYRAEGYNACLNEIEGRD